MFTEIKEKLLDILFPPTVIEEILREVTIENVFHKCKKTFGVNNNEIISIFSYKDKFIRDSIIEIKTNKNKYALKLYSQILYQEIAYYMEENLINPDEKIIVTYTAQHKDTYLDKGFNQTKELALEITKLDKRFEIIECLKKIKKTIPQRKTRSKKERLQNIKGSFMAINTEKFKDKIIILIDDVVTTGATLNESRQILKKSGANKVICFTIAH